MSQRERREASRPESGSAVGYVLIGVALYAIGVWAVGDPLVSSSTRLAIGGMIRFVGYAAVFVGVLVSASRFFR